MKFLFKPIVFGYLFIFLIIRFFMPKKKREKTEEKSLEASSGTRKKSWKSSLVVTILIVLLVVLVILVPVLLYQLGMISNPFKNLHLESKEFVVRDDCSMIVGNLIHSIQDQDVCGQKCRTDCGVRNLFYQDSKFTERPGDCNECKCYCK